MSLPFPCEQLQLVQIIASWRNDFLDPIFRFLNYADSIYFVYVLIPFVWIGFSWRWGLRLFYLMLANIVINGCAKQLFGWPRPCTTLPELGMLCFKSFGFPSGGAQTSMLFGGLLIYHWKAKARWIVGGAYIALISFSRLYLGVHYPLDILGGWTIALLLLALYIRSINPIEKWVQKQGIERCFFLSLALPLLLMLFTQRSINYLSGAITIGVGACISLKYGLYLKEPRSIQSGLVRGAVGVAGLFLILSFLPQTLPVSITSTLLGLWISLIASPFCKSIGFDNQ